MIINTITLYVLFSECLQFIFGALNQNKGINVYCAFYNEYIFVSNFFSVLITIVFFLQYNSKRLRAHWGETRIVHRIILSIALFIIPLHLLRLIYYSHLYIPSYILLGYSIYLIVDEFIFGKSKKT